MTKNVGVWIIAVAFTSPYRSRHMACNKAWRLWEVCDSTSFPDWCLLLTCVSSSVVRSSILYDFYFGTLPLLTWSFRAILCLEYSCICPSLKFWFRSTKTLVTIRLVAISWAKTAIIELDIIFDGKCFSSVVFDLIGKWFVCADRFWVFSEPGSYLCLSYTPYPSWRWELWFCVVVLKAV